MTTVQNKLFIGNLNYRATEQDLETLFSEYGEVQEVAVPVDRATGRKRGFAFVTFEDSDAAQSAITALNDKEFQGRPLKVNLANERTDRRGGGQGREDRERN